MKSDDLRLRAIVLSIWLVMGARCVLAADSPTRMTNGIVTVEYDPSAGVFSVSHGNRPFLLQATFGDFLAAQEAKVQMAEVGDTKQLTFEHPSGRTAMLMLRGRLPFLLVKTTIRNAQAEPLVLDEVVPMLASIDLDLPARDLRLLGYDGLAPADQAKTGYLFLAAANPTTEIGVVAGWLTHERASGLIRAAADGDTLRLSALSQYGRLRIQPGDTAVGETLAIGYFGDASAGLEQYADELARLHAIKVRPAPAGYTTWYHAGALDEKRMQELAAWCAEHLKPYGLDVLQIDDGWQRSRRDFGGHHPSGPYPSGMRTAAKAIAKHGFRAGLWLTPFGWDHTQARFAEHQDWFVHREDGSVYEVTWGGTALDMSHLAARNFLHHLIHRMSNDWGYRFFKLDALWAGLPAKLLYPDPHYRPDGLGDAVLHDPNTTNVEAYRLGLKTIGEAAGPEAYLLGCTVAQNMRTLGASIGLVNGMRVGGDHGRKWTGIVKNVKAATSIHFLHGRVWHNDPDAICLDETLSLDQVRAWASWVAVSGQLYMVSSWLPGAPAERLEVVRRTIGNHNQHARPIDLWRAFPAEVWHLGDRQSNRHVLALFNWGSTEKTITVDLARLTPDESASKRYVGFNFWENEEIEPIAGALGARLRPTSCHVIALRPVLDRPQVVSTSGHVTQGFLDLVAENWDPTNDSLVGVSRVVGGEPHEMRIVVPCADQKADLVGISPADEAAGVIATGKQDGRWVRVTFQSPESRDVSWQITFHSAATRIQGEENHHGDAENTEK